MGAKAPACCQMAGRDLTERTRSIVERLGRGLPGKDLRAGLREFEADEPVAGDAAAVHFRGGEFPAAGGLEGGVGRRFWRGGGNEIGVWGVFAQLGVGA